MRNQSSELLRAVHAGESVVVTNHGTPVALISPYVDGQTPLEQLRAAGQTRPPQAARESLKDLQRARIDLTTAQLLEESRRDY